MDERKPIGKILLRQRALTQEQLEHALAEQKGGRLASQLAADGVITDVDALKALSEQHGIPGIDLTQICLKLSDLELLPREMAEKYLILPVLVQDDRVFIAMASPSEKKVLDELEFVTGKKVYPYVALERALAEVIDEAYGRKARGETYYAGSACPPDLVERARQQSLIPPSAPAAAGSLGMLDFGPSGLSLPSLEAPGVVVDDDAARISREQDTTESEDADLSRELSVVQDLPPGSVPGVAAAPGVRTILVVDDEPEIRKMLVHVLTRQGHRVVEADQGRTALALVKDHAPDLIILDAMLPEVHGFEIARRIRGSQRYGHIPIIMISAVYRGWRYAEDLKQTCGVNYFIEKPFRISDVVAAVQACLEPAPAAEPRPEGSLEAEAALRVGVEAYSAGRLDEAIQHLQRGIGIDPLAYRLRYHLGLLYGKKGLVYEAIGELEAAVKINATHFAAFKNLAILYQKAGFRHKAVETWEQALSLAPDDPTRQSIREHLLNLL